MKHKYPAIDLIKLNHAQAGGEWRRVLEKCDQQNDINRLVEIKYGVCRGMDNLAKVNLNTDEICLFFAQLIRSIEVIAKRIIRRKYPSMLDAVNSTVNLNDVEKNKLRKELTNKRKRDIALEKFLQDSSF